VSTAIASARVASVVTTATDLADSFGCCFVAGALTTERTFLSDESFAEMLRPHAPFEGF